MTDVDPASGMTTAMPGSSAGDAQWQQAMREKQRLLRTMSDGRG